jgi:hypothetical protein
MAVKRDAPQAARPLPFTLGIKESSMLSKRRTRTLREWWQAPATTKDRAIGAFVGGLGGFWIGALGRIGLSATPVSLSELAIWALVIAAGGVVAGIAFPKPVTVVLFPLTVFGGSN